METPPELADMDDGTAMGLVEELRAALVELLRALPHHWPPNVAVRPTLDTIQALDRALDALRRQGGSHVH